MSEPDFDCVAERVNPFNWRGLDPPDPIWHVAKHRGRTSDFTPIRCSADEGIVFPGPIQRRRPTCPDCVHIIQQKAP